VLCLKKEGRTIGYSWYYPLPMRSDGAGMRIHMFGVDPGFRGQGWGKKILLASLERMRERKARTVELTVDSDNSPALALYSSRGFSLRSRSRWYEKQER
jgi:mycothiol synthase